MTDNMRGDELHISYPANSKKSKDKANGAQPKKKSPEEKKVDIVVEGKVVQRKRGFWRKFGDVFTNEDAQSVGSYIVWDVLVPALKAMVFEAGSQGLERTLFGEVRASSSNRDRGRTNYGNMYRSSNRSSSYSSNSRRDDRDISPRGRSTHDFGEVILESRGEAEEVLDRLTYLIEEFEIATVNDLYDLVGITGSFVDEKWGWTDLRSAKAVRVRDGYLLDLPKTVPVDY